MIGSRFESVRKTTARLLLALALLPTGPVMGLGAVVPEDLGFQVSEPAPALGPHVALVRRTTSLELARQAARGAWLGISAQLGEVGVPAPVAAAADAARAWSRFEKAGNEGVGSSHAAATDGRPGSSSFAASIQSAPAPVRGAPRSPALPPLNSKLSQRASHPGAASKASAGPAEAFAPPLAQPEQEVGSATEKGRAQDPEDPYGIRERPSPSVPSAPLANVPPPPSPPDFSQVRSGAPESPVARGGESAATPEVSVPVLPAWNLLSISWTPGDPAPAAVLAPIAGAYTRAYAFEACDPADPWKLWDPAAPGASDLAAITPAIGFWLEGSAAATLPEAGPEPVETAIPLCLGWNLVGFPASSPRPVAAALASIAGEYLRVFGFDASDPEDPWEVYDPAVPAWANDLTELRPGRGYWIYATAATTLAISNATDGPTVAILDPVDLDEVTAPIDVVGTVRSPTLAGWELAWRAEGDATWVPLAAGATTAEAEPLGTFDPTLLENGLYELRLAAADTLGRTAEQVVDVVVDGQMKIGHFALTFVDLEVPLAGLPIQVLRSYDSRRKERRGDFGFGWTLEIRQGSLVHNRVPGTQWRIAAGVLPCQQALELAPHLSTIRLSDREIYRFRPVLASLATTGGGCFANVGYQFVDGPVPGATLQVLGNTTVFWANGDTRLVDSESFELFHPGRVRLTTRDGRKFELERGVGVTKIVDANDNTLTFTPGGIAHSSGVSIAFERDGDGRVTSITDPAGGELAYGYDAAGDLVAATDRAGAVTTFGYLAGHYLEAIVDPLGRTPIRNEYGPDDRLTRHVDAYGHEILYDHRIGERLEDRHQPPRRLARAPLRRTRQRPSRSRRDGRPDRAHLRRRRPAH